MNVFWYLVYQLLNAVVLIGIPLGFLFLWGKHIVMPPKYNPSFDSLEFVTTFFIAGIITIVSILVWAII